MDIIVKDYQLSEATSKECASVAAIYNQYLGKATMDTQEKEAAYFEHWLMQKSANEELWTLVEGDEVRAWGIIKRYSDRLGYMKSVETSVYCHKDHRNKGLGSYLKRHLISRCRELGYHHLLARIFSDNEHSINYNLRLGYSIVGVQKEIGWINGAYKDVTIRQMLL